MSPKLPVVSGRQSVEIVDVLDKEWFGIVEE